MVADSSVYGTTYNLNEGNYTVRDLAETAASAVSRVRGGEIPIRVVPSHDNRSYRLSADRARHVLGFVPRFSPADSIADVVSGIEKVGITAARDAEFRNITRLKELHW
jgi:nucleoside-diphosphate-sugar epimerase